MEQDMKGFQPLEENWTGLAGDIQAEAFRTDPLYAVLFPIEKERGPKLRLFFQFLMRYGFLYGEVYVVSPASEAAAIWIPSEMSEHNKERNLKANVMEMVDGMGQESRARIARWGVFSSEIHHRVAPFKHFYLQVLGVHPGFQGRGLSSILVRPILARLDKEDLPSYLETQNPDNVPLYEHFGYEVADESIFPDSDLTSWAMIRYPTSRSPG
ncbi:MAG: GNAT family N-acetyltransferase [Deltaproteobacteria bacterium]|nr:GNAT family N-acetyltransferase [Deltaproteobacteria bacterium]